MRENGRNVWERLERLLHREHHAVHLGHRELLSLPVDERVESGDCLAGLHWLGDEAGGRIRLLAGDNDAKFRAGDRLRLGNGDPGQTGFPVAYESFNIRTGHLVVRRDAAFREGGTYDALRPLILDPEATSLSGLALEAIRRVVKGESAAREVLELEAPVDEGPPAAEVEVPGALDGSQRIAFASALSDSPVCLVQGPPGSGKTFLLAWIVAALARSGAGVLVTAYTHRAVNNALRKIAEVDPEIDVVKAGPAAGRLDLRGTGVATVRGAKNLPAGGDRPVVAGMTLFGARGLWDRTVYDVVVFDEAAQVPLAYAPIAMLSGKRFVLVGDHRQLGPIVRGRHDDPLASRSLFEHLAGRHEPHLLSTTYRMNSGINRFPGRHFYRGRLAPSEEAADAAFPYREGGPFDAIFDPATPAVLAQVDHRGFRTRSEPEARAVVDLVADALLRQGLDPDSMAVVSPFRAQLRAILTLLRKKLDGSVTRLPVVDTVERIQGQEREMVVVSLTASDPEHLSGSQAEFFFSPNRLNVTLTRARTKLIVVASRHLFRAVPRNLEQLRHADLFRRLYRELPRVDLSSGYLGSSSEPPVPRPRSR